MQQCVLHSAGSRKGRAEHAIACQRPCDASVTPKLTSLRCKLEPPPSIVERLLEPSHESPSNTWLRSLTSALDRPKWALWLHARISRCCIYAHRRKFCQISHAGRSTNVCKATSLSTPSGSWHSEDQTQRPPRIGPVSMREAFWESPGKAPQFAQAADGTPATGTAPSRSCQQRCNNNCWHVNPFPRILLPRSLPRPAPLWALALQGSGLDENCKPQRLHHLRARRRLCWTPVGYVTEDLPQRMEQKAANCSSVTAVSEGEHGRKSTWSVRKMGGESQQQTWSA